MSQYEIHQVEREDLNEGWIWLRNKDLKAAVENRRPALLVKNEGTGNKVRCEILYADPTYLANRRHPIPGHNQNLLILSAWYRRRLGIEEKDIGSSREFEIRSTNNPLTSVWWQFCACVRHPQMAVVMSTVLAIVGTGLGIIGLAAVFKDQERVIWDVLGSAGFVIVLLGLLPLIFRVRN